VAECIHQAQPLQPHLPLQDHIPRPCISISSLFQRPGSSRFPPTNFDQQSMHLEARALQIVVFCAVRSDRMDLPVAYATLTMNFRKTLYFRRCALVRLLQSGKQILPQTPRPIGELTRQMFRLEVL